MLNIEPRQTDNPNNVTPDHLRAYGEITSLLWRAGGVYENARVFLQRSEVHTPVNLGFYGLAYAEGIPIGFFTYAMISDELQLALLRGEVDRLLTEPDWHSGDNMWIATAISPYERAGLKMTRYIVENMPLSIKRARALRAYGEAAGPQGARGKRIVEWYRDPKNDKVKVRTMSVEDLIRSLTEETPQ